MSGKTFVIESGIPMPTKRFGTKRKGQCTSSYAQALLKLGVDQSIGITSKKDYKNFASQASAVSKRLNGEMKFALRSMEGDDQWRVFRTR